MFKVGVVRKIFGTERYTVRTSWKKYIMRGEIWGSRRSDFDDCCLVGCNAVWLGWYQHFWILLFNPEDAGFEFLWNVGTCLPNYTQRPRGNVKFVLRGFHDATLRHILLGYRKKQDTVSIRGGDEKWASLLFYFLKYREKGPVHKSDARCKWKTNTSVLPHV